MPPFLPEHAALFIGLLVSGGILFAIVASYAERMRKLAEAHEREARRWRSLAHHFSARIEQITMGKANTPN